jgi:predicted kinase
LPSLVLINGAPGSGKSTLARLLLEERPLALLLDIDTLRGQLGRWSDDPQAAGSAARRLALAMIRTHLDAGFDVIVPQFLFRLPFVLELERVALEAGSRFFEIVLVSSPEEASARFRSRAHSTDPNHQDAQLLQNAPDAQPIETLYAAMLEIAQQRPNTRFVESIPGDIDRTFAALCLVIDSGTARE